MEINNLEFLQKTSPENSNNLIEDLIASAVKGAIGRREEGFYLDPYPFTKFPDIPSGPFDVCSPTTSGMKHRETGGNGTNKPYFQLY